MHTEKLETIKERIRTSRMRPERKTEVLHLLEELSKEIESLPSNSRKEADQLVELANQSTKAAIDDSENYPLKELEDSIQEFEVNYPDLVRIINRICMMFANIGV